MTDPAGAQEVRLELQDGSVLQGYLDSGDSERCRLRSQAPGVTLQTSALWKDVRRATYRSAAISAPQLKEIAAQVAAAPERASTAVQEEIAAPTGKALVALAPRITTIQLDAHLASWDADAEIDGLVATVYPLDRFARFTPPARGTIEFVLYGQRPHEAGPSPWRLEPRQTEIGRWTFAIHGHDFEHDPPRYHLEFCRGDLMPRRGFAMRARLVARLSVPAVGIFEARQPIYLRSDRDTWDYGTSRSSGWDSEILNPDSWDAAGTFRR